jgi:hypothetical protein
MSKSKYYKRKKNNKKTTDTKLVDSELESLLKVSLFFAKSEKSIIKIFHRNSKWIRKTLMLTLITL